MFNRVQLRLASRTTTENDVVRGDIQKLAQDHPHRSAADDEPTTVTMANEPEPTRLLGLREYLPFGKGGEAVSLILALFSSTKVNPHDPDFPFLQRA